jgi:hypothetical protein
MPSGPQVIVDAIRAETLPQNATDLFAEIYNSDSNVFFEQELTYCDYKDEFPHSLSNDYFGGIARLICAFHNSYGGIIVYGVHDITRDPGHNKVKINIERFNNALREHLSTPVEAKYREYYLGQSGDASRKVDVLLIPKRPMSVPPVRIVKKVGNQKLNKIRMRVGHEVVAPTSIDLPLLYSSRDDFGLSAEDGPVSIQSALPPSPATIKEFIGRRDALDRLYTWLFSADEPRTFLFGKGGSGKSTIAFEFAKMVGETGGSIPTKQGRPIDYVLFLSAKLSSLEPLTRRVIKNEAHDFSTAIELYQAVLLLVGWTNAEAIYEMSQDILVSELQKLFDTAQILLVVDDIDTLTTAGRDPGMDALYKLLVRAQAGGKILYTMRNAPTQSLANSIEVPGLDPEEELSPFVEICANQFKLPPPSTSFITGELSAATERRPLAVEVLIGLRRTTGDYQEALRLYQGHEGDELRSYLFQREYSALPKDNRARLLLAALGLLGRPSTFSQLRSVLQFSPEQLSDAISQTLEMFLQTTLSLEGETTYSMGAATEQFINSASSKIFGYDKLKASVQYFKSPFLPKNPQMAQIQFEVTRLFNHGDFSRAVEFLTKPDYPAAITQHPTFNMLKGRAYAKSIPPKYEEAREAFKFSAAHGASDIQGFREWYWMEKDSGFNDLGAIEVCDIVIGMKGAHGEVKAEFGTKKGFVYRGLATQTFAVDPEKSISYQIEALVALLDSLEKYKRISTESERYAKTISVLGESFRYLFISVSRLLSAQRADLVDRVFKFFAAEAKLKRFGFDLIEAPTIDCARIMANTKSVESLKSYRTFLQRLYGAFEQRNGIKFDDEKVRAKIIDTAKKCTDLLALRCG